MSQRNIVYLQEALICIGLAFVAFILKTKTFSWGEYTISLLGGLVKTNANSLWYYNFEAIGMALFASSVALVAAHGAEIYKTSVTAFVVKYTSVSAALFFICRAVFHLLTFNLISIFEYITHVALLAYVTRRAYVWYKDNLNHQKKNESVTTRGFS